MGPAQTHRVSESPDAANIKTSIEYIIYTFQHASSPGQQDHCASQRPDYQPQRWQKQDSTPDLAYAVAYAQDLFSSGDFCKVEIKQKYTDPVTKQIADKTVKVFRRQDKRKSAVVMTAGLAMLGGVFAFALAHL